MIVGFTEAIAYGVLHLLVRWERILSQAKARASASLYLMVVPYLGIFTPKEVCQKYAWPVGWRDD